MQRTEDPGKKQKAKTFLAVQSFPCFPFALFAPFAVKIKLIKPRM